MALEFALHLPVVALLAVALLSLVGLVRTSMTVHEAARVGARLAAVDPDDAAVVAAAREVAGPDADVAIQPRPRDDLVTVDVRVAWSLLGLDRDVTARAVAMVEPERQLAGR